MGYQSIDIDISDVIKNLDRVTDKLRAELVRAVEQGALIVEAEAKRMAPTGDSGQLRASIGHAVEVNGNEITGAVGTNLYYAPYVEFGTGIYAANGQGRKTGWRYKDSNGKWHFTYGGRPQPFLYPALRNNQDRVRDHIAKYMRGVLD